MAETAASTGPLPVAIDMRSWSPNFSTTVAVGTRVPVVTCRNLSAIDCLRHAVDVAHQVEQVVVVDLLLPVGQCEELVVGGVQFFRREVVAQQFEPVHQCRAAAAGRQGDDRLVEPDVLRVDDLVGLPVFEHAVLVDARRVGEGVAARRSPCWAARACSSGSTPGARPW